MFRSLFLSLVFITPTLTFAADEPADCPVAVLSVDRVFKAYPPLQERLVPLKQKAAELDKAAQLKQVEMETVQVKIRGVQPGSPEFDNLQVLLAKLQTELRLFVERERKNLRKAEAEIYANVYREMEVVVKKICQERKFCIVIRQNEGNEKDDNPDEILKWINRPVIFAENLDITDDVIAKMKAMQKGEDK
jgi:Skp family chaperone for outer membrane proteins